MNVKILPFSDPSWSVLDGGYQLPFDGRRALRALEAGGSDPAAWHELWEGLYHQGDIGPAAFAAIPHLVRIHIERRYPEWQTYALAATVEEARMKGGCIIPDNLKASYRSAWQALTEAGISELWDAREPVLVSAIIAVVAIAKGQTSIGRFALLYDETERSEILAGL